MVLTHSYDEKHKVKNADVWSKSNNSITSGFVQSFLEFSQNCDALPKYFHYRNILRTTNSQRLQLDVFRNRITQVFHETEFFKCTDITHVYAQQTMFFYLITLSLAVIGF